MVTTLEIENKLRDFCEKHNFKMSHIISTLMTNIVIEIEEIMVLIDGIIVGEQEDKYFIDLDKLAKLERLGKIPFKVRKKIGQSNTIFSIDNRSIVLLEYKEIFLSMIINE